MLKTVKIASALLMVGTLPTYMGCSHCCGSSRVSVCDEKISTSHESRVIAPAPSRTTVSLASDRFDLPPHASAGECWAKIFVPPKFETQAERVVVRPSEEKIEVIPAQYEWKEKRVQVRPAETRLEVVPAEYEYRDTKVISKPGHTDWERQAPSECVIDTPDQVVDVFCLVNHPPVEETRKTRCLTKAASVRKVEVPAEFETVREQCLVSAATTRTTTIAAEYETVETKVKVADGGIRWERVMCEAVTSAEKINEIKVALLAAGYTPDGFNGELSKEDWLAIHEFQKDNDLGVTNALTFETLNKLGVATE